MTSVLAITTSRADYSAFRPVLRMLESDERFDLRVLATGTHTSVKFGSTIDAISDDGYRQIESAEMDMGSDSPEGVSRSIGLAVVMYAEILAAKRPDVLLLLGDRFEMYSAAVAALPFKIPVAHIHGGEITIGAFDDALRHSTTKLSHLHFVSTAKYAERVVQLGEEPWRVTVAGAPALDELASMKLLTRQQMEVKLGVTLGDVFVLATFHPVTLGTGRPDQEASEVIGALEDLEVPILVTMPNADPGGNAIREVIINRAAQNPLIQPVENVGTIGYFSLMACAALMAGNSSSGVIEAASFGLPVVNIGARQEGRERGENVSDVPCERAAIVGAARKAMLPGRRNSLRGMTNPYGAGEAAAKIVGTLAAVNFKDPALLVKRFHDISST